MGSLPAETDEAVNQSVEIEDYGNVDAGAVLRRAREHYGLSLEDVEKHLHIRRSYLEALEEGKPEVLPGRVYAIGFIRSYAEFLGLDGGRMIQVYKKHLHEKDRPEFHFPIAASESKLPSIAILSGSIAVLLVFVAIFIVFQDKPQKKTIPEPNLEMTQIGVPDLEPQSEMDFMTFMEVEPAAGLADAEPEEPKLSRIVVYAQESAWIEITGAQGEEVVSKVLKPGDRYDVPDQQGLKFTTGNIGGLVLTVDGHDIKQLGTNGQKIKDMPLNPQTLQPYIKTSMDTGGN